MMSHSGRCGLLPAGYVEPYEVALALMENAIDNGVQLRLGCEVYAIEQENKKWLPDISDESGKDTM